MGAQVTMVSHARPNNPRCGSIAVCGGGPEPERSEGEGGYLDCVPLGTLPKAPFPDGETRLDQLKR